MSEQSTAVGGAQAPAESKISEGPVSLEGILEERKSKRDAQNAATETQEATEAAETPELEEMPSETQNSVPDTEISDDQTSETVEEPETVNQDEAVSDDEAGEPPIDAPHFWSAEGKEHFATLDPKTQQYVLDQDKQAQAYVTKTRMDLAQKVETELRRANSESQAKLQQLDSTISALKHKIIQQAAANPDVRVAIAEGQVSQADLEAYADQQLSEANAELARQEEEAQKAFLAQRNAELQRMESPLLDPAKAEPFLAWANSKGITPDVIAQTEALHLDMAHKAFLYEQGEAGFKAAQQPKPKPPAKPTRPSTKGSGNTKNARLKSLKARADESGSLEDMLAYRKAKRETRAA